MHRPGLELQRMTPRHKDRLLFGTVPWLSRAREEHDILSQILRNLGVEVLYFTELLQDTLEYQAGRNEAISLALADAKLGEELRGQLRTHLADLAPEALARVLIAGLTPDEVKIGHGVVYELLDRHDFVLDPLPNLVFIKDSSFWIGDRVAVASLASERRMRETQLASVVYRHHPRFAGTKWLYGPGLEHVDGGDVLLLAPGVLAVGVGHRTTAAGTERLARRAFDAGLAHTVVAVPMGQLEGHGHLDTVCAVVDIDSVVMHPAVAYTLTAHTISARDDGMRVSRPQPFLEAAAQAIGIDRLEVIGAGAQAVWGPHGQWEDASNVLAVGRRVAVSHERNARTNAMLEAAGVRVIPVPSSELGSVRGGPRCMSCPVARDPAAQADNGYAAVSGTELADVRPREEVSMGSACPEPALAGRYGSPASAVPAGLPSVALPGQRRNGMPARELSRDWRSADRWTPRVSRARQKKSWLGELASAG
jgi:arginine deiminase